MKETKKTLEKSNAERVILRSCGLHVVCVRVVMESVEKKKKAKFEKVHEVVRWTD